MVSGRYFFPKAPLLCLKWMPAREVTSVNSMGPAGRAELSSGIGTGGAAAEVVAGAADSAAGFGETVSGTFEGLCLQPANKMRASAKQHKIRLRGIKISRFPFTNG